MKARCLITALCLLVIGSSPVTVEAQQDARQILDRAIETLGGEAYRQVTEIESKGRFYQFQRGELVGGQVFTDYFELPDKQRTEYGEKGQAVRINNGQRGWNVQDEEVEVQRPEQVEIFWEELRISLDYVMRVTIHEAGTTLQHVGRDMIDFKRVDILEVRDQDRTRFNLYIERDSGLLVKKTARRLEEPAVLEEVYSNYHEIDGILTPLLIDRYTDGQKTMQIRFEEVDYNPGFSEELFTAEVED